jgi:hypothetical protein
MEGSAQNVQGPLRLPAACRLQEAQALAAEGHELVKEVWGVVSDYYLDARGGGFDQAAWAGLRDKYLEQPLPTHEAAYRWGLFMGSGFLRLP